jgi:hypothetical protein
MPETGAATGAHDTPASVDRYRLDDRPAALT